MKMFFKKNIEWMFQYFKNTKWMLEILSLFFVLQTFLYQIDFGNKEVRTLDVDALKIIFWILIFIISLLLYVKTDIEYTKKDDDIQISIFSEAVFSKSIIRLLIFTLLSINTVVLFREILASFKNYHFNYFWIGLCVLIFFELIHVLSIVFKRMKKKGVF